MKIDLYEIIRQFASEENGTGQYPVCLRNPEKGTLACYNPKHFLGDHPTEPPRSLRLWRLIRKSLTICPKTAPIMHLCSTYVLKSPQSSFCSHIERFLALWYAPFQFSVVLKAHNNASLRIIPSSYSYDRYQNQTRLFKMSPQLTSVDFLGQDTHLSLCSGSAASNGTCIHPTFIISTL